MEMVAIQSAASKASATRGRPTVGRRLLHSLLTGQHNRYSLVITAVRLQDRLPDCHIVRTKLIRALLRSDFYCKEHATHHLQALYAHTTCMIMLMQPWKQNHMKTNATSTDNNGLPVHNLAGRGRHFCFITQVVDTLLSMQQIESAVKGHSQV